MHLSQLLKQNKFVVTCEIDSPKGINVEDFLNKVDLVKDYVNAISIADNQRAVMRAASMSICHLLKERGVESIMELTARYRNCIVLQSDLLGAAILGIENILLTAGYDPSSGDHAAAKSVDDLNQVSLVNAALALTKGKDLSGHDLNEAPSFCIGVLTNTRLGDDLTYLAELREQTGLGVDYIQTQPVYETEALERFLESINSLNIPVLVGHIILKSSSMARFMNSNLPGITIPDSLIDELEASARDKVAETSLQISIDVLNKMKSMCHGIHLMPVGWEKHVPRIIEAVLGKKKF